MLQPSHSPILWFSVSNSHPPLELGWLCGEAPSSGSSSLPPSQGMWELNEPAANIDPKAVLAEGQAVLQDLQQQQESLPNPELWGSQLSVNSPALKRVNPRL